MFTSQCIFSVYHCFRQGINTPASQRRVASVAPASTELNPTRPKAFDFAAEAESVVGELNDNFSCDGLEYGYYADQSHKCQVFHICMPVKTATGRILDTFQFSFFCPNRTRFSQDSRTCIDEARAFPCHKAHTLYDLNKNIGKRPNKRKKPVDPRVAVNGAHKFDSSAFSGAGGTKSSISTSEFLSSESSFSSNSGTSVSRQSSAEGDGKPDPVDSEFKIDEPVVFSSRPASTPGASFSSAASRGSSSESKFSSSAASTDQSGHRAIGLTTGNVGDFRTEHSKPASGSDGFNQFTSHTGVTEPILPPGAHTFSKESVNRQNVHPGGAHEPRVSTGNFGTSTTASAHAFSSSSHDFSGFSSSTTPATPAHFFFSTASPASAVRAGSDGQFTSTAPVGSFGPSIVSVSRRPISTSGQSSKASINSIGSFSFSSEGGVNNIQGSSIGFAQPSPANAHSLITAVHTENFKSVKSEDKTFHDQGSLFTGSHTHGAASGAGGEDSSSTTGRIRGSSLSSRGRSQSASGPGNLDNNRISTESKERGSVSFSLGAPGSIGSSVASSTLTLKPVIPTRQPIHQPFSPTNQPAHQLLSPTHQPAHQPFSPTHQPSHQPLSHIHQPAHQPFSPTLPPTHQSVSFTQPTVFTTHQLSSPTRKPSSVHPSSTPLTSGSSTALQSPGSSAGVIRVGGETRSTSLHHPSTSIRRPSTSLQHPSTNVHPPSSSSVTIPTTTEYFDDNSYEVFITTETPFEAERNFNDARFYWPRDGFDSSLSRGSSFTGNSVLASTSSAGASGFTTSQNIRDSSDILRSTGSSSTHGSTASPRVRGSGSFQGSSVPVNGHGSGASAGVRGTTNTQGSRVFGTATVQGSTSSVSGHESTSFQESGSVSSDGHRTVSFQGFESTSASSSASSIGNESSRGSSRRSETANTSSFSGEASHSTIDGRGTLNFGKVNGQSESSGTQGSVSLGGPKESVSSSSGVRGSSRGTKKISTENDEVSVDMGHISAFHAARAAEAAMAEEAAAAIAAAKRGFSFTTEGTLDLHVFNVTRNRGKKKFQPSPFLLLSSQWTNQNIKSVNNNIPRGNQRLASTRGGSGTSRQVPSKANSLESPSVHQTASGTPGQADNAIDTSSKFASNSVNSFVGVSSVGGFQGTAAFSGEQKPSSSGLQTSNILTSSSSSGLRESTVDREPNFSLQIPSESSRVHGSSSSSDTQRLSPSTRIRGASLASKSRGPSRAQESFGAQGSSPVRGFNTSPGIRESSPFVNTQKTDTGFTAQHLVRTNSLGSTSVNGFNSNRMTSAVEEPKQNEDYYTTTEFESEFTTETSFLEESEAHDTLPTTYRPEISLSVDPSQTVSNVRSRALESQSSSSSLTSNSLTSVKNSRRRGRGRLTTSSTDPSSAPSVPEGPSQDISKDNTQPSKPTSRHHKTNNLPTTTQATPPVTVRAAGVQVTPFTPAGSRRRVTSSRGTTSQRLRDPQPDLVSEASVVSSDGGAEVAVGGEESSQSSGARKVVKKKIVINGRPGSRGSQEVDTTEISTSAQRPRGRHELGTPQASTPSPRPRGRHELGTPQVSTPATTNQEDEEKRKHQIALEALAKFNPALANARILSVRFIPKTKNKSEKSTTEDPKETATDTPPAVGSSRSINGQRRNSRRINDVATTTPATVTQSSRGTSRERLRPLAVRQPSVITTEAPATATPVPAPFQKSRNSNRRGSSRKETLPTNEVTTTPASASISDSSDSSFSNEFQSQRRGTVRTDHASSSRRRVLKKVTPLSHGNTPTVTNSDSASSPASSFSAASRSSSSRNSVSSSSDSSLSLSSITTEDNLSSTAENSGVSSGRNLRVVGTSIKSSVSRVSNNKDDALLSSESSSAASSSGTLSQSNRSTSHPGGSNNSRSPTRRVTRPNTINTPKKTSKEGATDDHSSTKSTHNPLTDVEIEALSALANVTTSVGSSPQESARVFPDILPEAEDDTRPRRINSRRTKNWTSRGRSRSESNS